MSLLRDLFLNNLGLKLIALVLAFLLWVQTASRQTIQTTVSIPVEFVNMPAGLEISNNYEKVVDVVIRSGSGRGVDELTAVVDLRRAEPGMLVMPLTDKNIRNRPSTVEILSISPQSIRLQLERTASRIVPVEAEITGSPALGFEVSAVSLDPERVKVVGPESRLNDKVTAITAPIVLNGRTAGFTENVYMYLEDPLLRLENPLPVSVTLKIEEKRRRVHLRDVKVKVIPARAKFRLFTQRVEVSGSLPLSFKGEVRASDFQALVDLSDLQPVVEPYEVVPRIIPPTELEGIFQYRSVNPPRVRIRKVQ